MVIGFCLSAGIAHSQCRMHEGWEGPTPRERIRDGWRSGELTREEMMGLHQQRKYIRHQKRRMLRDGYLDPFERRRLEHMYRQFDREIWRQKHDLDTRYDSY